MFLSPYLTNHKEVGGWVKNLRIASSLLTSDEVPPLDRGDGTNDLDVVYGGREPHGSSLHALWFARECSRAYHSHTPIRPRLPSYS